MIQIKKFIDKVSALESRQVRDVILPMADARGLRDEIAKLLADQYQLNTSKKDDANTVIKIDLNGGSF